MKQRRRAPGFRRNFFRAVVVLLLGAGGAIVNVAMAWGCAMWSTGSFREVREDAKHWPVPPPDGWPLPEGSVWGFKGFGYTDLNALIDAPVGVNHDHIRGGFLTVFMAGWPCRSLCAERHRLEEWTGIYLSFDFDNPRNLVEGIAIPPALSDWHVMRCLPTRPLWSGCVINSALYAVIPWLLFAAPGMLRRRRRIRRGLCPACAYPVGVSDFCTECGKPVRIQSS